MCLKRNKSWSLLGNVKIKVLHTPGHTIESSTYLLIDENDKVFIFPIKTSMKQLKGMVPATQKKVTLADMEDAIEIEGSKI